LPFQAKVSEWHSVTVGGLGFSTKRKMTFSGTVGAAFVLRNDVCNGRLKINNFNPRRVVSGAFTVKDEPAAEHRFQRGASQRFIA
jgi:hypothetical protein